MLSTQIVTSSNSENMLPLTSARNGNFKTPARSLKRGRVVHNENSVYGHPKAVGFTGKKKNNVLFTPPPQSGLKTNNALRFASKSTALAEITNRTPFTKALAAVTLTSIKQSKSFAIFNDALVPSTPRISLSRKKLRLPRPASKNFETPENKGNYWDVSDTSIEGSVIEDASMPEEDYDDVEYAPPTAIDPKFDLGFDMPDYKKVGASLMSLFRQTAIPDGYDPASDFDSADLLEGFVPLVWEKLELPDILPNDIFPFMTPSESAQASLAEAQMPNVETSHSKSTEARSHARTTSVQLRAANTTQPRTGSVPSKNICTRTSRVSSRSLGTTDSKATSMGISKPTRKSVLSTERKHGMRSHDQAVVPDDTVLSLLTDFGNEPLGGEFLFTI